MDYTELAADLHQCMQSFNKAKLRDRLGHGMRGESFMLYYLSRHGGDVLPGRLSEEMDVSSARVAHTLNGLEQKGYIVRRIDPSDRRRILIDVTEKGKAEAGRRHREMTDEAVELLALLGEEDARHLIRIIGKLSQAVAGTIKQQTEGNTCSDS